MLNVKVLIRCDGGNVPEIGTGHVHRCITLANYLIKKKILKKKEISFITRKKGNYLHGFFHIKNCGYHITNVSDKNLTENSDEELKTIIKIEPQLLLIDRLKTTKKFIKKIISNSIKVISFDDEGLGAVQADYAINAILKNKIRSKNILSGYRYLITDTQIKIKSKKKINNSNQLCLVISLGGFDKRNIIFFVLDSLKSYSLKIRKKICVFIMVKNLNVNSLKMIKSRISFLRNKNKNIQYRLLINSNQYNKIFSNADIAIVNGGITIFNALSNGTPCIGLPQYQHQLRTLKNLSNKRVVEIASNGMALNNNIFISKLDKLISNREYRVKMKNRALNIIDGKGIDRVSKIVRNTIKET